MSRTLLLSALVVAVLLTGLVTASAAVDDSPSAIGDATDEVVTVANTTNYMSPTPGSTARNGYVRSNVDVAAGVGSAVDQIRGQRDSLSFTRRYEGTNGSGAKLALVRTIIDRTETRLADLDARQESLFRSYTNGSISGEQFLRSLARLDARATQCRQLLEGVNSRVRTDRATNLPVSLQTRLATLRAELVTLPASLTSQIAGSLRGTAAPIAVYTEGSDNDIVLATANESAFIRQATLRSEYTPGEPNQFDQSEEEPISVAFDRARTLYPWVSTNLQSINRIAGFGDSDVYYVDLSHPHGDLRSYIHGGSTDVFLEEHRQRPSAVPVQLTASNTTDTLAVRVNASAETGPMRVSVTRGPSNAPVRASVSINGDPVGSTGADGALWTVRPSGSLRVNATAPDGTSAVVSRP